MDTEWDVIVAGASFGGLAAAMELAGAGRVLLIDRDPVGQGVTSACGTLLRVLERLDAMQALEQVHEDIVLHLPRGRIHSFRPRYPFATFDYETLCRVLRSRTDAQFLEASVEGMEDGMVRTTEGAFVAPVVIDASGWRAALGSSVRTKLVPTGARSMGVELSVPVTDQGLHFWVLPREMGCGVTWSFPAGERSRVGIACYVGKGGLKTRLEGFLDDCVVAGELHGGVFPSRLRDPVAGNIFLVGDAAGQCLPLTGEGIRPALVFGQQAGRLARSVIEGELDLTSALSAYRRLVLARSAHYRLLGLLQRGLLKAPDRSPGMFARLFGGGPLSGPAQSAYWWLADPDSLRPGREGASQESGRSAGRALVRGEERSAA